MSLFQLHYEERTPQYKRGAVVVVTENNDGSLSPAMSQLVKDTAESIPVVILCNGGYNAAAMTQEEYVSCIAASGMSAEQARIMTMLLIRAYRML
jgi:L-asparaginase/Glu-tRNA(Gln) amidotransferase subunit D